MLRAIITTAILAFSATLCAQAYKDSVKAQFLRYTDLLTRKEFAKSTEYINPGFFQLVPKPQLIAIIESTYNNPSLDFAIETPVIISIGDVNVVNGHHFLKMQYSNFLTMRFKAANGRVPDTAATRKSLINRFGQNNVSYDTATGAYKIFVVKDVIANSADKQTWTFVVVEEKQKTLLEKFIPKELL